MFVGYNVCIMNYEQCFRSRMHVHNTCTSRPRDKVDRDPGSKAPQSKFPDSLLRAFRSSRQEATMLLQLSLCTLLLHHALGDVDLNALDRFRYDKATVKMGETARQQREKRSLCSCKSLH